MHKKLKILHLEDLESDAEIVKRVLLKGNIDAEILVVDKKPEFVKALRDFAPDVILSDHSLPSFNSLEALNFVQDSGLEIPFILITSTVSEDFAVTILKEGADDYLLKDRMERLPAAITNALEKCRSEKERKKYHDQLMSYKYALDQSAIVNITDTEGNIGFVNENFSLLSKYSSTDLLGRNSRIFNSGYHAKEFFKGLWETVLDGKIWKGEIRNKAKDGTFFWADTTIVPFIDNLNKPYQFMVIRFDITERKKAEEEIKTLNESLEGKVKKRTADLIQANKALEAFSYSVSHDLRSPIRSIIGFTQIINKDYLASFSTELKELFEHVESSSKRMNAIVDDLLNLAKYGKEKLKPVIIDMSELVNKVWYNLYFSFPHRAVLETTGLPAIEADASMMQQVMVNLLSNAIKYSSKKENPEIKVGFEVEEETITFFIKDNGAGFDMKHYNRLFGAFQRLHGMSEFEGTGIGLLLVKQIIERHAGTVWAESKPNEGATFYFALPNTKSLSANTPKL